MHTEFRDSNVPAGHEQLRVLRESLEYLPSGVEQVPVRSDTAGMPGGVPAPPRRGQDERFGVIGFAVAADVAPEFRRAVSVVAEGG